MVRIAQLTSQRLHRAEGGTLLSEEIALILSLHRAGQSDAFAHGVDDRALHTTSDRFRRPLAHHWLDRA
jgi:hypothetical protein